MQVSNNLVLFAGGGTGGHLFPGLAVAHALQRREPDLRVGFVGSDKTLERRLVQQQGFHQFSLPAEPLSRLRRNPFSFLWRNWRAFRKAIDLVRQERPRAIIGLGGYASAPLVLAAKWLGIPVVLLEQNSVPGKSTRWLARWSACVCLSYPESVRYFGSRISTRLTGNPVREEIAILSQHPRTEPDQPTLLILVGSQGATPLNEAVVEMFNRGSDVLNGWRVVHQTGENHFDSLQDRYSHLVGGPEKRAFPFIRDMAAQYRATTLVVSRAGATSLAEIACAGIPAILIPYPQSADNHQLHNARAFASQGAAVILSQGTTSTDLANRLLVELNRLVQNRSARLEMSRMMHRLALPTATESIVSVIDKILHDRGLD